MNGKRRTHKVIPIKMDTSFFYERAVQSLDKNHYDKALKYFQKALEIEPNNPINQCNLAGIYSELGQYEQSNAILLEVLESSDPQMTECYFYMANNYFNLGQYELAEEAVVRYLECDEHGHYLEESEEMIEMLSYELQRPIKITGIKCKKGAFEHELARGMMERGQMEEATKLLERITADYPDFLAANNNLALAYLYNGRVDLAFSLIDKILRQDPGNVHALCNLAVFYQTIERPDAYEPLLETLRKTYPVETEQVYKLAMTLGLFDEHRLAYRHFMRLIREGEFLDAVLYHHAAAAACNLGLVAEAERLWKLAVQDDPEMLVPRFYLEAIDIIEQHIDQVKISYHVRMPFSDTHHQMGLNEIGLEDIPNYKPIPIDLRSNPLVYFSFEWALEHGDHELQMHLIEMLRRIGDEDSERILRAFLEKSEGDEYLTKVIQFVLQSMGKDEPSFVSDQLPVWKEQWQTVLDIAFERMSIFYDPIHKHDVQALWLEFLSKSYARLPRIVKEAGWSAALEYLVAKMHQIPIPLRIIADKYNVSVTTVHKNVKMIDRVCELQEKMEAVLPQYHEKF